MLSEETISKALQLLKKGGQTHYAYFFSNLSSPEWIKPLKKHGFFQNPPEASTDGKYIEFPFWPESQFLLKVASKDPNGVLEIMKALSSKTNNYRIHDDFNKAASQMPALFAKEWAVIEAKWINSQSDLYYLSQSIIQLIKHLISQDCVQESILLLNASLQLNKSQVDKSILGAKNYNPKIDVYEYDEILEQCVPLLVEKDWQHTIEMLCNLLDSAFKISGNNEDEMSAIWCPAIEDHEQNKYHDSIENKLIISIRDAAEKSIAIGKENVLFLLEKKKYKTLLRISLYLRTKYPELDPNGNSLIVLDKENLQSLALHHELYHYLGSNYGTLSDDAKQSYLDYANEFEDKEKYSAWYLENYGHKLTENDLEKHCQHQRYTRLYPIRKFLSEKYLEDFNALKPEFKELDHPDFLTYSSGFTWGPTSPKKADELSAMSIDEIIAFLSDWKSSDDIFKDSPEGLGRELGSVVKNSPDKFASRAYDFRNLDPTYIREMLFGIRESLKENKSIQWSNVLQLCDWILKQDINIPGRKIGQYEKDPSWQWTRNEIACLLSEGFKSKASGIPFAERNLIWKFLQELSDDNDPEYDSDTAYSDFSMDPATKSINTTRGNALHTIMRYSIWVNENVKAIKSKVSYDDMPEVRGVLGKHLDLTKDNSLAIRSIYGQWIPWIIYFDELWVNQNIKSIFPKEDSLELYYLAAWDTYLTFCNPNKKLYDVLKSEYEFAVVHINDAKEKKYRHLNPKERLSEHVMLFYLWGLIDLKSEIIKTFFEKSDANIRKHALAFIGRGLYYEPNQMNELTIKKSKEIIKYRLESLRDCNDAKELKELEAFDLWFASKKLDSDWVLEHLLEILKHDVDFLFDYRIMERMEKIIEEKSALTLKCIEELIHHDKREWFSFDFEGRVKKTLRVAMGNSDPQISNEAKRIVNILGSKGYINYRELLHK